MTDKTHTPALPLAVRSKEAAELLSISQRKLWSLTNAGEIPHVKVGRATVYPVDALREWLAAKLNGNGVM